MVARDNFSTSVKETLAKRVNACCSNPHCGAQTAGPHTDPRKALNVGVAAHITAAAADGPRFDSSLTAAERAGIDNGIWLCQRCGKLIDNDPQRFSVEDLRGWKAKAEALALKRIGGSAREELPQPRTAGHAPIPRILGLPYPEARAHLVDCGWQPSTFHWSHMESPAIQHGNGPHFWELGFHEII